MRRNQPQLRNLYDDVAALDGTLSDLADAYEKALGGNHRIVDTARIAMFRGASDAGALKCVHDAHPGAQTKANQISQYRSHVRAMGIPLESNVEVKRRMRRK